MSQLIAGYIDIILKKRKEQERAEAKATAKEVPPPFKTSLFALS